MAAVAPAPNPEKPPIDLDESDDDLESGGDDSGDEGAPKKPAADPKYEGVEMTMKKEKAPDKKKLSGEKPEMPFKEISEIKDEECREALLKFVDKHCCYGKGAATDMTFEKVTGFTAFRYILESYTEKRTTKNKDIPYIGDFVDGPDQGTPPGVWDMECTCKKLFKDEVVELKVPHTEVIKNCARCKAKGKIKCPKCKGKKKVRCYACGGDGRRTVHTENGIVHEPCWVCGADGKIKCPRCVGKGKIQCPVCKGWKQMKIYLVLRVKFKNHKSEYIYETTDLPDELIKKVSGESAFTQELDLVWPITDYPVNEINENSQKMIKKHEEKYNEERFLKQRQNLIAVPVTQVDYKYDDKKDEFFVYGNERKVYAPKYPQKCCWGCEIL